jgi:hypothetical protein
VATLALAGCGDPLDEFRDALRPLEQRAEQQRSAISTELRTATLGSNLDARALHRQAATLAKTHDEIAAVDAPAGYEKPFAAYVRANDRLVRDLNRYATELAAGRARGVRRASRHVVRDIGRSQSARLRWLE